MAQLRVIKDTAANLFNRFPSLYPHTLPIEEGVAPTSPITTVEGLAALHKTRINLNGLSVSLSDTNVGGGSKIYTFPEGLIRVHGAYAKGVTPTTTTALATTLNASKTLSVGVGTVQTTTQASGTLTTTEQDVVNAFSATSSATVNVAGTGGNGKGGADLLLDGTTTAAALYLNVGVPTATDIDADATVTFTGIVTVFWTYLGDY